MKKILLTGIIFILTWCLVNAQNKNKDIRKLLTAYSAISNLYVDKINNSKVVEDAIKGILTELDPHSSYTNAEETRKMNEPLEGNFDGIGIQFNMLTDTLYVIQVISGGPSEKGGLLPGDRIIAVDDSVIAGVKMKNTDVVKLIRGEKGTEVHLRVKRGSIPELLEFKIIRDKIPVYSVDAAYMADKKTGYIRLSRFAMSSVEEFEKEFSRLKEEGMKNLILDLQSNGGGYLNIAYALADEFLNKGKLVFYTQGNKQARSEAKASEKGMFEEGKLIVLVDEHSASASEILAGAVQDWDRGVIIGRRTFGKGLVQRPVLLPDSSMIRLTVAKYYTPSGRDIQKPYEKGNKKAYDHELIDRYNKGELMNADSIHFPDSLKYNTLVSKRTVYGGGGIMPDIFVPIDSTRNTKYHIKLVRYGIINKAVMNYVDRNRAVLNEQYPDMKIYKKTFQVEEDILNELKKLAEKEKIEFEEEQFNTSRELIELQLKALIARDLFELSTYFEIMNEVNDSYNEALRIIKDKSLYNKLLTGSS